MIDRGTNTDLDGGLERFINYTVKKDVKSKIKEIFVVFSVLFCIS